ncbi:hypothetical protein P8H27_11585 [Pseudomonas sp. sp1636]|uniref:hypothetical protein n=1 Tax=Pseudomonas sp. sp1636 TaxID=3036707 RepID=UPI0025A51D74|nr:hypothetical protein [Pseudomonas sp. sp1636]MDM8349536.1 hypothetical protein [Pseudomonas sp. sp1636]
MKLRDFLYLILLLPLAACSPHVGGDRGGWVQEPPAHYAPPPQVEWRWDPDLDVYVVLGSPHLYYRERIYYRWHDEGWYWSDRHDGHWNRGHKHLPPGLYKKYGKQRRSHGGGGY